MTETAIPNGMRRISGADTLDRALLSVAVKVARHVFTLVPDQAEPTQEPVEAVLQLATLALPGWWIEINGEVPVPDGHWRCYLRETRRSVEIELVRTATCSLAPVKFLKAPFKMAMQRLDG